MTVLIGEELRSIIHKNIYFEEEVKKLKFSIFGYNPKIEFSKRHLIFFIMSLLNKFFDRNAGNVDIVTYNKTPGGISKGAVNEDDKNHDFKGTVFSIIEVKKNDSKPKEIQADLERLIDFMRLGLQRSEVELKFSSSIFFSDGMEIDDKKYNKLCKSLLGRRLIKKIGFKILQKECRLDDLESDGSNNDQIPFRIINVFSVTFTIRIKLTPLINTPRCAISHQPASNCMPPDRAAFFYP
ncbi:hypothetical protein [Rahnella contaminans]|uniref:hypothetical protein n=1 Tax=Rahnella contaminans TaxID=2703882 RepID=UPI0023DA97A5|nr:hypothetical protein [Rahnella contaminans]MDF1892668.1 hypothetical protein [Rahnella contaminans]